jgi:photosystem II stability/assembly factor-like uncharacterized protein
VYVGTRGEGLFRVAPGLRSHEQVETPAELSKVRSLCITGDQFLAGTEPAQVYSWEDRKRWVPFGDVRQVSGTPEWWYPVQGEDPHVRHLSADPHRSGQFYGSLQVGGIAITPDGGDTWHDRRNLDLDVHMVQAHPAKPGTVYAGSGGKGLFRSHDWGESWENIAGTTGNFVVQFAIDPQRPDRIFVGTARGGVREWRENPQVGAGGEIFRSEDGGDTWRKLTGGLPEHMQSRIDAITLDATNPQHVFVGAGGARRNGATDGGLYYSGDAGESWRRIADTSDPLALLCVRA